MYNLSVTWLDGLTASYPSANNWSVEDGCVLIDYELESHVIPLTGVRAWKVERA